MKRKIVDVLEHIQRYCQDIDQTITRFGNNEEIFAQDQDYRNSVCMSILQIGELTKLLPDDFRESTKGTIYWPALKSTRNLLAHDYEATRIDEIWATAVNDIPVLHRFCDETIEVYRALEQEALDPELEEEEAPEQ